MAKINDAMKFLIAAIILFVLLPSQASPQDKGKILYDKWCSQCHGEKGDGKGYAADFVFPKPRDFTRGTYKFHSTPSGEPPVDEDIIRSIRNGNPGTSMPPWKRFSDDEVKAIVAYIKKFSPDTFETKGTPIKIVRPSTGKEKLIEQGKKMYEKAKCWECHGKAGRGDGEKGWQEKFKDDWGNRVYPADQTSPWEYRNGSDLNNIYKTITVGIDGTPMTSYGDTTSDEQRWSLAYFVKSQQQIRKPGPALKVKKANAIPSSTDDALWKSADYLDLPMAGQIIFDPRDFTALITNARVRGLYTDSELAVMVEWTGKKHNIGDDGHPPDGARVQFPLKPSEVAEPYFFMGDKKTPVDIWQWKASDNLAVELNAKGISDVSPQERQDVKVIATYKDGLYRVVFRRPLNTGNKVVATRNRDDVGFEIGKFIPFEVTLYDGRNDEENNKGAISAWYYMVLEPPMPAKIYVLPPLIFLIVLAAGLILHKNLKKDGSKA